jgi:hypothetical protein
VRSWQRRVIEAARCPRPASPLAIELDAIQGWCADACIVTDERGAFGAA